MKKRILAMLLTTAFLFQFVQTFALAAALTEEELYVSEEFAAAYPNGYFDLSAAAIQTREDSGRIEIEVVRSGGTAGRVAVTLKAIDVTATEADYLLDVPEVSAEELSDSTEPAVSDPTPDLIIQPRSTGLRAVREAATGTTSDRIQYTREEKAELVQTAREAVEDYYDTAPGTEFTLVFEPGQRTQSFGITILNDTVPEAEEQLVLVMLSVSGGGALGDQRETIVNIADDEEAETPVVQFSATSYTAEGDRAEVTLVRSAGLNYYAGGTLSTFDGTALAGAHYTGVEESFLFVPGQEALTVSIPVAENHSGQALGFGVQVVSNGSCAIAGGDRVEVTIPAREEAEAGRIFRSLLAASEGEGLSSEEEESALLLGDAETPVTMGVSKITYYGGSAGHDGVEYNFSKVGSLAAIFKRTSADWYEVKIMCDELTSGMRLNNALYKNLLSSIKADLTLYECGHERNFDVDIYATFQQGNTKYSYTLLKGREGYDTRKNGITVSGGNYQSLKGTEPFYLALYITNGKRDYAAMRLHSLTLNYKHFNLETAAYHDPVYTFDFAAGTAVSTLVEPGAIEFRNGEGKLVKDFYTSENSTVIYVSIKDVKPGYYLKELRLYNKRVTTDAQYKTIKMGRTGGTLVIDSAFLDQYGSYTVDSGGAFLIQPVFEREEAQLTIRIDGADRGKGYVSGVTFPQTTGDASVTFTKNNHPDEESQITLRVGDTVNLVGIGSGGSAVTGFYLSKGDGTAAGKKTEVVGAEDAGTISFLLDKTNVVTPIFGERTFSVSPDPTGEASGTGSFQMGIGEEVSVAFPDSGQLAGVKSGQEVNVLVIPPEGYTTQWINRSGDANGNGVLDDEEIRDANGNLYRRYDYNGDGELDAEYKNALYGDLFRTRINQSQTQYYYSFVPVSGLLHTGKITGYVQTYEYDIYHGYSMVKDRDGVTIRKTVPVSDASVVMGGSYDSAADAQTSYAAATNSKGKFTFDVTRVLKNSPYFLSIKNGDAYFYTDYIVPSLSGINYVIPLFASMRPVSITASSTDSKTVSGSVVILSKGKKVTFDLTVASLESNVAVSKVYFNIRSENGTLRSSTPVDVAYGSAKYTVVASDAFVAGDTLQVVLEDQNGHKTTEYNTGYEFRPELKSPVGLPDFMSGVESVVLPLFQSVTGGLDLGNISTEVPPVGDTYTIRIGAEKAFEGSEKILHEASKSGMNSEEVKKEIAEKNKKAETKKDTEVKTKTSLSSKMSVKASLELIIKYDKTAKNFYFGSLQMMVTLSNDSVLHHETSVTLPIGLTIVAKLDIGGEVTGFVRVTPATNVGALGSLKNYMDENGNFAYTDSNMFKSDDYKFYFEGGIILQPKITLNVEGNYAIGSVSVEGSAQFRLEFTTSGHNNGTVTLTAGISVKALGIEIYSKNFGSVEYSLFGSRSRMMLTDDAATEEAEFFSPVEVDYVRGSWLGEELPPQHPGPGAYGFTEATLLTGVYPDPDIQTMRIDETRMLMVFLDTVPGRDAYNKAGLYSSVSSDNGQSYSQPVLLNPDSQTTDSMPRLIDLGDSIACLYSTLGITVSSTTRMEEILEQTELEMVLYNKSAGTWSSPIPVTKYTGAEGAGGALTGDFFTNSHATAVYDSESGRLLILYMKSDYTSDTDRTFRAADLFDTSEDGHYSAVACILYDTKEHKFLGYPDIGYPAGVEESERGEWDACFYGQMFPDTSIDGIADPLVLEATAAYQGGKAYMAYTVDTDNDPETAEDRDIYLMTYSFETNVFTPAVKVSDIYPEDTGNTVNENPQFVLYDGRLYLFYTSDSSVFYVDIGLLLNHEAEDWVESDSEDPDSKTPVIRLPKTPGVALDGAGQDNAPTDYRVLLGDDGKIYLVWTEPTLRYADGVEPGTPEALEEGNSFNERQIYAAVYYNYQELAEDTPAPAGYGTWSGKVQLTAGPGKYGDVSASVMGDGHILLAAQKESVDGSTPPELVAMTLLPAIRAEMTEDLAFGEEYPQVGETTVITASFRNLSLMALSQVSVEFFTLQDGTESSLGTALLDRAIGGGQTATAGIEFTVPETPEGLSIRAVLSGFDPNRGEVVQLAQQETPFPYGAALTFNTLRLKHVAQDYYSLSAQVLHTGNKPLQEGAFILSLVESEDRLREIARFALTQDMLEQELFTVSDTFILSNDSLKAVSGVMGGSADLEARIVSGGETLCAQQKTVTKDLGDAYEEIISTVSGVSLSTDSLSLDWGGAYMLAPTVTTELAETDYTMAYRSSNPAVATVSDSGLVRARLPGSATIMAYAVPNVAMRILSEDGYAADGNLLDMLCLEDFRSASVALTVSGGGGGALPTPTTPATANVTTTTLQEHAENGKALTLSASGATATFDSKAVEGILAQAQGEVAFSAAQLDNAALSPELQEVVGSRPVFEFTLKSGDKIISELGGSVEVKVPYTPAPGEDPNGVVIYYLSEEGRLKVMPQCKYDAATGQVVFRTSHFSKYVIGYKMVSFADVPEKAWYAPAVAFIAAREITSGTSETTFSPEAPLTRGQFITLLLRAYGIEGRTGDNFSDAGDSYYTPYLAAAKQLGISSGVGSNQFAPEKAITRQEMFTLLYNALKVLKQLPQGNSGKQLSDFADQGSVAPYALEAMTYLVETGAVSGIEGKLAPAASSTRAQMAQLLCNLLSK